MTGTPHRARGEVRRAVGRLLRLSAAGAECPQDLRPLAGSVLRASAGDDLLLSASRHGVTRLLWSALSTAGPLEPAFVSALEASANRALRDHLRVLGELPRVARALEGSGTRWLALKGPVLAEVAYRRADLREYVDLDVLVEPESFVVALEALEAAGCLVLSDWSESLRERAGEVTLATPGGVLVDLHWHLVNDWRVRKALPIPAAARLLDRARPVRVGGVPVSTLDEVDTVLHVAVHACTSGGWRLLWLRDLQEARLRAQAGPGVLTTRAQEWGAALMLAAMARRADRVLGGGRPDETGLPPLGVGWLRALGAAERVASVERATGAGSVLRILTKSTRSDGLGSVRELARRSAGWARNTLGGPRVVDPGLEAGEQREARREFSLAVAGGGI